MTKIVCRFLSGMILLFVLATFAPPTHGQASPYAWGLNNYGQLGDNSTAQRIRPVLTTGVLSNKTVVAVAVGDDHSLALCSDGTLAAWGDNTYYQFGNGNTTSSRVPVAVPLTAVLTNNRTVVAIGAGIKFSLALCSDGTVAAWGNNTFGQLGNGSSLGSSTPGLVLMTGALANKIATGIAAGGNHCVAVFSDGTVAAWGLNSNGQIGDGSLGFPAQRLLPVQVTAAGTLNKAVAAGAAHSLALRSDGTVAAWGFNSLGQLGNNTTVQSLSPVLVDTSGVLSGKPVVAIATGGMHSIALYKDGNLTNLAAWGQNNLGQLGDGTFVQKQVPVMVATLATALQGRTIVAIAGGNNHSLALCSDGVLAAWGQNTSGQLGDNSTTVKSVPVPVYTSSLPVGAAFTRVFGGSSADHTLALVNNLAIICPASVITNICGASVVVNFPNPAVTGGTLEGCVPPSGSVFNLGTTVVTCTATNATSTNTCTFTVTVSQNSSMVFVSDAGNYTVQQFTTGGNSSLFADANDFLSAPYGVAFDNAGLLYVANSGNNTIMRFDGNGNGTLFAGVANTTTHGLKGPSGLAFDSTGTTLYVSNLGDNSIWKFSTTGGGVGVIFANTSLNVPYGLAMDSSGFLYAANSGDNSIMRFSTAGSGLHPGSLFANMDLNSPIGLAFDSNGRLYVSNSGNHTIRTFSGINTSTLFAGIAGSTAQGLNGPAGLAFDSSGNLYVANLGNNTIEKFTTSAVGSIFADAADGLSGPFGIAMRNPCLDLTPVTIACPADLATNSCGGGVVVNFPSPTVTNGVLRACVPPSGSVFPIGQTTVTCTATNASSTNTCAFTVTVGQIPALTINCPVASAGGPGGITTNICGNSAVVNFANPTVIGGTLQGCVPPSGSAFPLGPTVVTCTATNACGANTCAFTVTVTQVPRPIIVCATNKTVQCGSVWTFDAPTASDGFGGTNVTISLLTTVTHGLCPQIITRTWLATDACGNTNTCTQTVTLETPLAFLPVTSFDSSVATYSSPYGNGAITLTVSHASTPPSSAVNASPWLSKFPTLFPSANNFWATSAQSVRVIGNGTFTMSIDLGAYHNLSPGFVFGFYNIQDASLPGSYSLAAFDATNGPITLPWRLIGNEDDTLNLGASAHLMLDLGTGAFSAPPYQAGQGSDAAFWDHIPTNTATIVITGMLPSTQDGVIPYFAEFAPPILNCASNKTVNCGTNWTFDEPTATDSCGGTNVTVAVVNTITNPLSPSIFSRIWQATDTCGNSTTCTQAVTVLSAVPPTISCPSAITTNTCGNGVIVNFLNPVVNGGSLQSCVPPSGSFFASGTTTVTCTATNACGSTNFCTFTVTVSQTPAIVITCPSVGAVAGIFTNTCGNSVVVNFPDPIVSGGALKGCFPSSGSTFPVGTTTVTCTATNACGSTNICTFTVTVAQLPALTIHCPAAITTNICGADVILTFPNPTVTGGTLQSCVPPSGSHFPLGQNVVTCTATNACGSIFCEFVVTVGQVPALGISCPVDIITNICGTSVVVNFPSPVVTGGSLAGCAPLSGSSFTLGTNVVSCKATNACGTAATCTFNVIVRHISTPTIACPPTITTNICGTSVIVNFPSPGVAGGGVQSCQPPSGSHFYPGTTAVICTATNACGATTTCSFKVTVLTGAPPSNDNCANAITVFAGVLVCGTTCGATTSSIVSLPPLCAPASISSGDVWYKYTPLCKGMVTIDTCGQCFGQSTTFDTVLSVYTGSCGSFTNVACNDNANGPCGLRSRVSFCATGGLTYHIRVGAHGTAGGPFLLNVAGPTGIPPANDNCATATIVGIGSTCGSTECASASPIGSIPIPCGLSQNSPDVWYSFTPQCNGQVTVDTCGLCPGQSVPFDTVLSAYVNSCGALSQIACNDDVGGICGHQSKISFFGTAGVTYHIRVAEHFDSCPGSFRLNIQQATVPAPANDLCANATVITNGTYAFNNCFALTDGPSSTVCQPNHDVWFRYTPTCSGLLWIDTCNSTFNTVLAIYSGTCGNLNPIICNDNATAGACVGSPNSYVQFNALANTTYYIRVGGAGNATGSGRLTVNGPFPALGTCPPANGLVFARLFRVMGPPNNTPWSWSLGVPCCVNIGNNNVPGVPVGGTPDTLAAAFAASINAACGNGGVTATALNYPFNQGLMLIRVHSCSSLAMPFVFRVGPVGTSQQNQCVVADVTGNDPLPTSGPCSFNPDLIELPLLGADLNQNGFDDAIDLMNGTSADSNGNGIPDEVEACLAPELSVKPEFQIVQIGDTISLSVGVIGTGPFGFQWSLGGVPLHDGGPISGSTGTLLTIQNITLTDLGDYTVTITNACGAVTTVPATVATEAPPELAIANLEFVLGNIQFTFDTREDQTYQVEFKNNLADPSWTLLETVTGDGSSHQTSSAGPLSATRFYRVRLIAP